MAGAHVPPGLSLREATQRKLRRFSELRGTGGGSPARPGHRKGGSLTCGEICWAVTSGMVLSHLWARDAGPRVANTP